MARASQDLDSAFFPEVTFGAPVCAGVPPGPGKRALDPRRLVEQGFGFPFVGPFPLPHRQEVAEAAYLVPGVRGPWAGLGLLGSRPHSRIRDEARGWRDRSGSLVAFFFEVAFLHCPWGPCWDLASWTPAARRSCLEVQRGLGCPRKQRSSTPSTPREHPGPVCRPARFRAPCRVGVGAVLPGREVCRLSFASSPKTRKWASVCPPHALCPHLRLSAVR